MNPCTIFLRAGINTFVYGKFKKWGPSGSF